MLGAADDSPADSRGDAIAEADARRKPSLDDLLC